MLVWESLKVQALCGHFVEVKFPTTPPDRSKRCIDKAKNSKCYECGVRDGDITPLTEIGF